MSNVKFVYDTAAARVYIGTAADADAVDGFFIASAEDLNALTGPQLLNLYNTIRPDGTEVVKRFSDKPTAVKRIWAAAQTFVFGSGPSRAEPAPAPEPAPEAAPKKARKSKADAPAPAASRASRGHDLKPKAKVYPCREGTVQALFVDLLSRPKGVTMDELREAQHKWADENKRKRWQDATLRSGIGWDVNSIKGYGVQTRTDVDGRTAMHLTYPAGVTAPLAHTPRKGS